jgi:hypothetical protein
MERAKSSSKMWFGAAPYFAMLFKPAAGVAVLQQR